MQNDSPFAPWNHPADKDSPFAPWNNPFHKDSPFAPWNRPLGGKRDYDRYCEENRLDNKRYPYR
jgi:hypothetical protein